MASLNEKTGVLGRRLAAHLLRRTSYQFTRERIELFATKTAVDAVDELMTLLAPTVEQPIDYANGQTWINPDAGSPSSDPLKKLFVTGWWVNEALNDSSIGHKMSFFLHSNFVINHDLGKSQELFDYLALMRYYTLGNFKELALKVTLNPMMLKYLDGTYNTKNNPNENYAREFFELFTIGKGPQVGPGDYTNYTETDIQAAAKILTGIKAPALPDRPVYLDSDNNIPTGYYDYSLHDTTDKTFSAAFQNTVITGATASSDIERELQDFVDMIFAQDETARFICRKIYRFFVSGKIDTEIEQDIIEPLATVFRDSNYELLPVMNMLLKSQHFYDEDDSTNNDEIIGGLLKSPLELTLNITSYFKLDIPDPINDAENHYLLFYASGIVIDQLYRSNLYLFRPDAVAGYPAYYQQPNWHREWLTSSSIVPRYEIPDLFIKGQRSDGEFNLGGVQLDVVDFVKNNVSDPFNPFIIIAELMEDFCPEPVASQRFSYFLVEIFLDDIDFNDWTIEWARYTATNNDVEVRIALERLIKYMLFAPEFQLM